MNLRWLAVPLLILVLIVLMLWAPSIKWLWMRVSLRVVGGFAGLFVLAIVGLGALLISGSPKPQYKVVTSPTGQHQATLKYQAGFLGRDNSTVKVTRKGCCQHFLAYVYDGPSDIAGTTMTWLDESHLEIQYNADPNRFQQCKTRVADVIIICKPVPLVNTPK